MEHEIYCGRDFLGTTRQRADGRWEARDADGRRLGIFPDRIQAATALSKGAQLAPPSTTGEAA